MLDRRFHEEIDACRPGSRDIDEPEMSRLAEALSHDPALRTRYEAVQRLDARLGEAFAAVAVPAGLAERLLAALPPAAAPSPATTPADTVPAASSAPADVVRLTRRARVPSRRVLAAMAASILVAVGLWATFRSPAASVAPEMTSEAANWYEALADRWQPIAEAPADLPLPAAIVGQPRGWQAIGKAIAKRGVVYRLGKATQTRAVLFVLSAKRAGLPASAPLTPQSATGGLTIGAWQSKGLVYILVVQGDERAYRRFLNPGRQPLA
jgi:hypothetical protein